MAARYWRITGVQTYAGGDLELSALHLFDATGRIDDVATLTCSHSPSSGALTTLQAGSAANVVRFLRDDVRSSGFVLQWDFGAAVDLLSMRIGSGDSRSTFLALAGVECFVGGRWVRLQNSDFPVYPGARQFAGELQIDRWPSNTSVVGRFDGVSGSAELINNTPGPALSAYGTAALDAAQARNGITSLRIYGRDSGVTVAPRPLEQGVPYTIEAWVRIDPVVLNEHPSGVPLMAILGQDEPSGIDDSTFGIYNYKLWHNRGSGGGVKPIEVFGVRTLTKEVWHHIAESFDGTTLRLFLAGALEASISDTFGWKNTGSALRIGARIASNFQAYRIGMYGWIDDFRLTVGVARYTAAFTPPNRVPALEPASTPIASIQSLVGIGNSSEIPQFHAPAASFAQTARDTECGGDGRIWGTSEIEIAPNTREPAAGRVVLLRQRDKLLARETWADPVTGAWEFVGIDTKQQYLVLAEDLYGNYRPVVANKLIAEVTP